MTDNRQIIMFRRYILILLLVFIGSVMTGFVTSNRFPYKRLSSRIFRNEPTREEKGFTYSDQVSVGDVARYLCSDQIQLTTLLHELYDTNGDGYITKEEIETRS